MTEYKTVAREASAEQTIEKSKFTGYIRSVESREEAEEFIAGIRAKHRDATHNVPAFVIGDEMQLQWASDDGEPAGTSGAPVLRLLTGEGITNTVIVITRYFGGIKLGTGGLVRAYTGTARLALEKAGVCLVREMDRLSFDVDYSVYGKLQRMEGDGLFRIDSTSFEDIVKIAVVTECENTDQLRARLSDLTGGACSGDKIVLEKIIGKSEIQC